MKTLLDLMNDELIKLKVKKLTHYDRIEDFINDDKLSASFIRELSKGIDYRTPDNNSAIYDIAQTRARHSAITFLMGLVFKESFGLYLEIVKPFELEKDLFIEDSLGLWLLTALNHDIAYTLRSIEDSGLNYKNKYTYYLLQDDYTDMGKLSILNRFSTRYPDFQAYTYSEIEAYDLYARKYHSKGTGKEKIDHGILGGIYVFDKKIKYCISNDLRREDYLITKASALTIAQHNIYKSADLKSDEIYGEGLKKIHSYSDFVISQSTPTLLLLSLVDTVECVKRLSKKENNGSYLETLTVLRSIKMEVNEIEVVIDFNPLRQVIDKKNVSGKKGLVDILDKHISVIQGMPQWTSFNVEELELYKLHIGLKDTNQY